MEKLFDMKKLLRLVGVVISVIILNSCTDTLPKATFTPFDFNPQVTETADSLFLTYIHPVACPIQLNINTNFPDPSGTYATRRPIVIQPFDTLRIRFVKPKLSEKPKTYFSYSGTIGAPKVVTIDTATLYEYPFPKGRRYKIIQGYEGGFSHNTNYSRYAVDFALAVGDTVCAARDGVVVGLIKDYNIGGKDRKYRDYANYITLYHDDGTFTQYVHLKQNGAFVALGDTVKASQPIGLSGVTGFTSIPHLHFNALKPTADDLVGFPIKFVKVDGRKLKRGMTVQH